MQKKINTPLETIIRFSNYNTEEIISASVKIDEKKSFDVEVGKNDKDVNGLSFTLKDTDLGEVEVFMEKGKILGLVKVLNLMCRQVPKEEVQQP